MGVGTGNTGPGGAVAVTAGSALWLLVARFPWPLVLVLLPQVAASACGLPTRVLRVPVALFPLPPAILLLCWWCLAFCRWQR